MTGLAILPASAAVYSWQGPTGSVTSPVDGIWNTSDQNWNLGSGSTAFATSNAAYFGGASNYTVTLASNLTLIGGSGTAGLRVANTGTTTLSVASGTQTLLLNASGTSNTGNVMVDSGATLSLGGGGGTLLLQNNGSSSYAIGGSGSAAAGTVNINSGARFQINPANGGRSMVVSGSGTIVNINTGGSIAQLSTSISGFNQIVLGGDAGSDVTVNVKGGTLSVAGDGVAGAGISVGNGGNAVLTVSSGTVSDAGTAATSGGLKFAGSGTVGAAGNGIVNLDGGVIVVPVVQKISGTAGTGTATFNFNGGTLKPTINNASFLTGLTAAYVKDGGANIDTNGKDITIGQDLLASGTGGLIKGGTGTLSLSGANTFTGSTKVTGGTLLLSNTGALQASVLDVTGSGTATFAASGIHTLAGFQNTSGAAATTTVNVGATSALTLTGTSSITINGIADFTAISVAVAPGGSFALGGVLNLTLSALPQGSYTFNTFDGNTAGTFTTVNVLGAYAATLDSGNGWAVADGNVYIFDNATGVFSITAVPEPTSSSLAIAAGLLLLVACHVKLHRKQT